MQGKSRTASRSSLAVLVQAAAIVLLVCGAVTIASPDGAAVSAPNPSTINQVAQDIDKLVEFRDSWEPNSLEEAATGDAIAIQAWSVKDHRIVLDCLRWINVRTPALLERGARGDKIRIYRTNVIGAVFEDHAAMGGNQWILLSDKIFTKHLRRSLIHELVHSADPYTDFTRTKDFRKLIEPRIEALRALLTAEGLSPAAASIMPEGVRRARIEGLVQKQTGLPSAYSGSSLAEALAEMVSYWLDEDTDFDPPQEILSGLQAFVTRVPEISPSRITFDKGALALYQDCSQEAIDLFSTALDSDPSFGWALQYRGYANEQHGNMEQAASDWLAALDLLSPYGLRRVEIEGAALSRVAADGDLKNLDLLLENGAPVDARAESGTTALVMASIYGHSEVVQRLLQAGAEVDALHRPIERALQNASVFCHLEVVRLLLGAGAEVDSKDSEGCTSMWRAAQEGCVELVTLLLEKGAAVGAARSDGSTALMVASYGGHLKVVKLLLEKGADVNARSDGGGSALGIAESNQHAEVVQLLRKAGASPDGAEVSTDVVVSPGFLSFGTVAPGEVVTLEILLDGSDSRFDPRSVHIEFVQIAGKQPPPLECFEASLISIEDSVGRVHVTLKGLPADFVGSFQLAMQFRMGKGANPLEVRCSGICSEAPAQLGNGSVVGRAYTSEGARAVGYMVTANRADNRLPTGSVYVVNAQGEFRVPGLDPGEWHIAAMPPLDPEMVDSSGKVQDSEAFAALSASMQLATVQVLADEETRMVLGTPLVRIKGTIPDLDDGAKEVAVIVVRNLGGKGEAIKTCRVEGRSAFELAERSGRYLVVLAGFIEGVDSYLEYWAETLDTSETYSMTLDLPRASISGSVRGPDGEPAAGCLVTLSPDDGYVIGTLFNGQSVALLTDSAGRYEIPYVRSGTYTILAGGAGGLRYSTTGRISHRGLRVSEGEHLEGVGFELKPGGALSGVVKSSDGSPVLGATVFVSREDGHCINPFSQTTTDESGRFRHEGLEPGAFSLLAVRHGLASARSSLVNVSAGEESELDMTLVPGTMLSIRSSEIADGGDVRIRVSVMDENGYEYANLVSQLDRTFLVAGMMSPEVRGIGPLPPGDYRVTALTSDGREAHKRVRTKGYATRSVQLRLRGDPSTVATDMASEWYPVLDPTNALPKGPPTEPASATVRHSASSAADSSAAELSTSSGSSSDERLQRQETLISVDLAIQEVPNQRNLVQVVGTLSFQARTDFQLDYGRDLYLLGSDGEKYWANVYQEILGTDGGGMWFYASSYKRNFLVSRPSLSVDQVAFNVPDIAARGSIVVFFGKRLGLQFP